MSDIELNTKKDLHKQSNKLFVLWSDKDSLESRNISILAIGETLIAIVLYWWIAIYFDTHIHLITSLFVAPFLLLRSKQSIEKGIEWFLADQFGLNDFKSWSKTKRFLWYCCIAIVSFIVMSFFTAQLYQYAIIEKSKTVLSFIPLLLIGVISAVFATKTVSPKDFDETLEVIDLPAINKSIDYTTATIIFVATYAGVCLGFILTDINTGGSDFNYYYLTFLVVLGAWLLVFLIVLCFRLIFIHDSPEISVNNGSGILLRAIVSRFLATLRYSVFHGLKALPSNWWENCFIVDSNIKPELLPSINSRCEGLSLDFAIDELKKDKFNPLNIFVLITLVLFFLPSFLYRLSIKSTCWFYWPLFFLLRAIPKLGQRKAERDLCFPIRNPVQLTMIIIGFLWVVLSLLNKEVLSQYKGWEAVPAYFEFLIIADWSSLRVWDWSNLLISISGMGMLIIAGLAIGNYKSQVNYDEEFPLALILMHGLRRTRNIAVIISLLLGFGSVVLHMAPEDISKLMPQFFDGLKSFYMAIDTKGL